MHPHIKQVKNIYCSDLLYLVPTLLRGNEKTRLRLLKLMKNKLINQQNSLYHFLIKVK